MPVTTGNRPAASYEWEITTDLILTFKKEDYSSMIKLAISWAQFQLVEIYNLGQVFYFILQESLSIM